MSKLWFFEDVKIFGMLCPHKFKKYKQHHRSDHYKKQDFIYYQNDVANKVYIIEKGKVKLGYYTDDGTEIVRAILTKGELFGEKVVLGEEVRNEFAQSLDSRTQLCPVALNTMQDLIRENRPFSIRFYKLIGLRLKRLERRLDLLLFKDTTTRLKEFLNEMADDYGYCCPDTGDTIIKHPYTQKDIANLIGTSRPTLNIIMNELKTLSFLDFSRKEIRLKTV